MSGLISNRYEKRLQTPSLTSESITVSHWSQIPKAAANYWKVHVDKVQLIPSLHIMSPARRPRSLHAF